MDCDTCDELLLDLVYGELDEPRRTTVQHHVDGCAACRGSLSRLRRVRQAVARVGPTEAPEPSPALLEAIHAAARTAAVGPPRAVTPALEDVSAPRTPAWLRRVGEFAMRRQVAMAAVFLLSIGLGLRLVRLPGSAGSGDAVEVGPTEVIPAQEVPSSGPAGRPEAPARSLLAPERQDPHRATTAPRPHATTPQRAEGPPSNGTHTPTPPSAVAHAPLQGDPGPAPITPSGGDTLPTSAPTALAGSSANSNQQAPSNVRLGGSDPVLEQLLPRAPALNNDPYQVARAPEQPPSNALYRWAALEQQGDEFTSRGQLDQAITAYRAALANGPDERHRTAITLRLVGVLNRANRGEEARALSASLRPGGGSNNDLLNALPSPPPGAAPPEAPATPVAPVAPVAQVPPSANNLPPSSAPRVNPSLPRPSLNRPPTMRRSVNNAPMDQSLAY
jgi:hypothetical protein